MSSVIYEGVTALYRRFEDYDQAYKTLLYYMKKESNFVFQVMGMQEGGTDKKSTYQASMLLPMVCLKKRHCDRYLISAEILGVDNQIGSLDVGKMRPFYFGWRPARNTTNIIQAYIQGKKTDMRDRHKACIQSLKKTMSLKSKKIK